MFSLRGKIKASSGAMMLDWAMRQADEISSVYYSGHDNVRNDGANTAS